MSRLGKSVGFFFAVVVLAAGCGTKSSGPVVINYPSFQVGVNSSAPVLAKNLENFNTKFGKQIKIALEEIPGDQAYVDKMKMLLAANDLPDLVYAGGYNLLDPALAKQAPVDLTPYLNVDPEWKASFDQATLDFNSRNGKVYSLPDEKSLIGYFYNKELYAKAGIAEPAKTWEEFFQICDKLKAQGITPLSMDTADSGWLTGLWLDSLVATRSAQGLAWVNSSNKRNYETAEFIEAARTIQRMFQNYTTKDAVGGKYENGANNFLSGKTAMIANGPWMISDFSDETKAPKGFIDKVGVALYPNNGVFDAPMLGYFVAAKDKAKADAAVQALKYFTSVEAESVGLELIGRVPASTKVRVSDAVKQKYPLLAQLLLLSQNAQARYNYNQATWYPNTLDVVSTIYPSLATGKMTPEEFAKELSAAAQKN